MQAGFLDFDSLSEVALGMEPMLDQVRQGALTLDESTVALLLEAQGSLEDGISQLRAFDTSPLDVGDLLERAGRRYRRGSTCCTGGSGGAAGRNPSSRRRRAFARSSDCRHHIGRQPE